MADDSMEQCSGEYQATRIAQVFTRHGESMVIEDIPAKVCDVCGDTLLDWAAVERLWATLDTAKQPRRYAPVYAFAGA